MQRRVLFVCTGNIFRSLTAEYALRAALRDSEKFVVESAGTEDFPHVVKPIVRDYLLTKGFDVRAHRRRTVTAEMLRSPTLVIAMSTEHRVVLRDQFGVTDVPLFTTACGFAEEPLPDVDEAVADFATNPAAADAHVHMTIDRIVAAAPHLARRLAANEPIA
jgi:protein-tyrosine phosphatase